MIAIWRGRFFCGQECALAAGADPAAVRVDDGPPPSTFWCSACGREVAGVWAIRAAEAVREAIRAVREAALWDPKVCELSDDEIWAALDVPPPNQWMEW